MSDLTAEEQANVRSALAFLRVRCGNWLLVAKALRLKRSTLYSSAVGDDPVSARTALRVARLAGTSIDGLLAGKWPPPGTCPHCGQMMPKPAAR